MKLSKILVSVNLAAVLPIVSQAAGQAAEKAVSDKTAWLKENLASMGERKATVKLKAQTASFAKADDADNASLGLTTAKQLSRLRPFVANRKLPSEKDLKNGLVAQTPTLAQESTTGTLSGKISSFYNSNNPDYSNRPLFSSKSVTANNLKPLARSVHQVFARLATTSSAMAPAAQPISPDVNNQSAPETSERPATVPPQLGYPLMRQAERYLTEQPETTAQAQADQSIIDRYAQTEFGGGNPGDEVAGGETFSNDTASSAGPPPFPLNLLPQASLKQLVRGMARPTKMNTLSRQPSFGSWRSGPSTQRFAPPRNLPLAGFHSYVRSNSFSRGNNGRMKQQAPARNYIVRAPLPVRSSISRSLPASAVRPVYRQNSLISREFIAMRRQAQLAPRVAAYPPYVSQVRLY